MACLSTTCHFWVWIKHIEHGGVGMDPGYGSGLCITCGSRVWIGALHIEPQRSAIGRMKHEVGCAFYICVYIDYREREGVSVCNTS